VLVEEGQSVKKGELMIRLGGETDTQYANAQLELANAQKALNDLRDASEIDFAQTVIDLKQAREDHKEAEQYLNYLKNSPKVPIAENFLYYIKNHLSHPHEILQRTRARGLGDRGRK
jgi:hypothetical protein